MNGRARSLAAYAFRSSTLSLSGVIILAIAAQVCISALRITGAGATFPYPIYSKWFDEYHKLHPDIEVNYQSIGSGGGIRQVTDGTVDFGASDGPMTDEQLKGYKDKHGFGILHFPTVIGAVVPSYNLTGIKGPLKFTPEALAVNLPGQDREME